MQRVFFFSLFVLVLITFGCSGSKKLTGLPPYQPGDPALHDTIARLDSLFFDAYNNCKLDVFASLVAENIEFYHDRGGLSTSKPGLVESIKNNICGKVTRELLPGSIEVYRIPGFGAVQMGAHRFTNRTPGDEGTSRYAKFVHTWQWKDGRWQIARVISLH